LTPIHPIGLDGHPLLLATVPLPEGLSGWGIRAEMPPPTLLSKERGFHQELRQYQSLSELVQQQKASHLVGFYGEAHLWRLTLHDLPESLLFQPLALLAHRLQGSTDSLS
jgi:hypothetical protein